MRGTFVPQEEALTKACSGWRWLEIGSPDAQGNGNVEQFAALVK